MRVLGLNLLIAIALFGVAYVNSPRQEVVDAYRAKMRDLAVAHPEWRVLANAQVVKVKVGRDHASATLRLGDCTMPNTQASFERDEDGSWRQVFHSFGDEAYPLLCEEDYPGYD
jgi:hypothetical protein